jgi:hypothetical protein
MLGGIRNRYVKNMKIDLILPENGKKIPVWE